MASNELTDAKIGNRNRSNLIGSRGANDPRATGSLSPTNGQTTSSLNFKGSDPYIIKSRGYGGKEISPDEFRLAYDKKVFERGATPTPPPYDPIDPNKFRISKLKETLSKFNVQKTNLFTVTIKNSNRFISDSRFKEQDLVLLCHDATLPGVGLFTTNDYKRFGVGFQEQVPYGAAFNEIFLRFIGDGQGHVLNFFETWMNKIVAFSNAHDLSASQPTTSAATLWEPGEVAYKKEFQTEVVIETYNTAGGTIDKYTLYKAFPVALRDAELSWAAESQNSLMSVISQFSFLNWKSERFDTANMFKAQLPGLNFIQSLLKLGSIYSTFSAISVPNSIADIIQTYNNVNIIGRNSRSIF